jgi:hypothetical protein
VVSVAAVVSVMTVSATTPGGTVVESSCAAEAAGIPKPSAAAAKAVPSFVVTCSIVPAILPRRGTDRNPPIGVGLNSGPPKSGVGDGRTSDGTAGKHSAQPGVVRAGRSRCDVYESSFDHSTRVMFPRLGQVGTTETVVAALRR